MWIGSIKWNLIVASMVGVLTFVFSFVNNLFLGSLLRSLVAFLLFFSLMFLFRFLAGKVIGRENRNMFASEDKGQHIDLVTPEESAQRQGQEGGKKGEQLPSADFSQFTPSDFPHIARDGKDHIDPEEVARALRVFSNE